MCYINFSVIINNGNVYISYISVSRSSTSESGSLQSLATLQSGLTMLNSSIATNTTNALPLATMPPLTEKPRQKTSRQSKVNTGGRHLGVTCGVCGKVFNNSSALAKHKLTHSDERKYSCQICSKAFKRQDHL